MRSEFAQKVKSHDWYYAYSDDHRVWRKGQSEIEVLRRMHKDLECPYDMKILMHWAHKMILEEFLILETVYGIRTVHLNLYLQSILYYLEKLLLKMREILNLQI